MRIPQILAIAAAAAAMGLAITPGKETSASLQAKAAKAAQAKAKLAAAKAAAAKRPVAPVKKRYLSSKGVATPANGGGRSAGIVAAPKHAAALTQHVALAKPAPITQPAAITQRAPIKIPLAVAKREQAHDAVFANVATAADIPVENPAALIPFFEQLYRHQQGEQPGPVRVLQYGDSHTAADEWTGEMRVRLQEKFGDGGSGFSLAGRPWNAYRREDVRSGSTNGWHTDGLIGRSGDGVYGLGGISMSVRTPREGVYLEADGSDFELFYYQQPGGGALQLWDNGVPVERLSTDGEASPAYYHLEDMPGPHKLELETLDLAPVRLFGWVAEKPAGITYETLGINGATASIGLRWNEQTLDSNIARRNPSMIVVAYGTNEAGQPSWTLQTYREMFTKLLARFRAAAPTATILVIGPPDRDQKTKTGWQPMDQIGVIAEAQREAAIASGCAFWDERAKMGGKGSMLQWAAAGMALSDHVHFTGPGYHLLGDAVVRDLLSQYDLFLKARGSVAVAETKPPVAP